jgi:hypothetical protein
MNEKPHYHDAGCTNEWSVTFRNQRIVAIPPAGSNLGRFRAEITYGAPGELTGAR